MRASTSWTRRSPGEPTDYFYRVRLGHNDDEHIEVTEAEVQQFVKRIIAKLN